MADEATGRERTDTELLEWLRSALGEDGTLRVHRFAVIDYAGRECIVLHREHLRTEIVVSLPEAPGGGSSSVSLYADNGETVDPSIEPCVGAVIEVAGNEAAAVGVVPDRWGGWDFHVSAGGPTAVGTRPR